MAATKTSPKKAAPAADAAAADAGVTGATDAPAKADMLKMKELLTRVAAATGGKRANRETVEATLTVLANALKSGEGFHLPPLGKARIVKSAEGVVTVKLRLIDQVKTGGKGAKEGLATAEE